MATTAAGRKKRGSGGSGNGGATEVARDAPAPGAGESEEPEIPFEEALAKLEEVVDRLESGDLELEASLVAFERGVRLSRRCASELDAAEQRVEILMREGGALTRRLFAEAEPGGPGGPGEEPDET